MSIESEEDLHQLRRIGRIVGAVLAGVRARVQPGVTTAQLDRACAELLARHGARSAPQHHYGFPGSLCISVNEEAVHGVPGARTVRPGDLVKLDLVAELNGYIADAAVTVAVPPTSKRRRRLVACAERALGDAMEIIRAGRRIRDVGAAIDRAARRDGFRVIPSLGGHGVGRAIHEEPHIANFADPSEDRRLTDGLVIAVEPILCAGNGEVEECDDGWTIRTADGSLAVHHEHTLVVTRERPIVLTAA